MSVAEPSGELHLRSFTVDDPRLWDTRPRLTPEELALDVSDEEWDAFRAALAEG